MNPSIHKSGACVLYAEDEKNDIFFLERAFQSTGSPHSLNAVPFYARNGFRPCAGPERLMTSGVAVPIVRMEKKLSRR